MNNLSEESSFALQVHQLSVNYDKTTVLWDISLNIPSGNLIGIIGPNGAGKTTFIKAALGLIPSISGRVEFFGKSLKQARERVAYVPQRETVDWDFPITVRDLVLMGRYGRLGLFYRPRKVDVADAERCLDVVGMASYAHRQINQLSGGQQQRVFIARALLQEADVYFMDEPFAGIDLATEAIVMDLLRGMKEQGKTVFVVHHDLMNVENYFDWVILLNTRLVAYGNVDHVFNEETLSAAYGRGYSLFDEALKLSKNKRAGLL